MSKKALIKSIYILCCILSDNKVPYNKAKEIIYKSINNDFSFIGMLPSEGSEHFLSLHAHILEHISILNDTDKNVIVNNIVKELYLMVQYLNEINTEKDQRKRELAKYNSTLKSATIIVLLTYIEEGVSLKDEFNLFKEEYKKYAAEFIGPLAKLIDCGKFDEASNLLIDRKASAYKITNRYSFVDSVDLRTVWEDDETYRLTSAPMSVEEQEQFKIKMAKAV